MTGGESIDSLVKALSDFHFPSQMHHLQDQNALIPKRRGNLPNICGVVLFTITMGCFVLLRNENDISWIIMAVLTLTLGPLLYGICLLVEEMLFHSSTRYRGKTVMNHMLPACGLWGRTLLTTMLAGFLQYLVGHPLSNEGQYCKLLCLCSVAYILLRSLGVLGPSEVEVSDICEKKKMNVAHGLAWSFYLGYLKLVLPGLVHSITQFRAEHQFSGSFGGRGSHKLLILIPLNANIANKLESEDDNIRFYDNLPNIQMDRAGVKGRVYKHSVYRVLDNNGRPHNFVAEYATPLLTLYGMSHESSAGLGEPERREQVLLFFRTLQDILDQSLECRNLYKLILINDEHEEDPHFLSKTILRHLKQQEREEFCVTPPPHQKMLDAFATQETQPSAPPMNAEPLSREPTLMYSLEKPQPLKEAEENSHY